jgi:type IV secretion system protein VirD4
MVTLDPSCEVGPMVARARRRMGHRVVQMDLQDPESGCNVLSWIHPETPGASIGVLSTTAWICGDEPNRGRDVVFDSAGRNLVACLLAHMIWDSQLPPEQKTLAQFIDGITMPEDQMRKALSAIAANSESSLARRLARTLYRLPDETFGGAYFNASTFCSWLFVDENAQFLSAQNFAPSDLPKDRMSIFLQIPLHVLQHTPAVGRVAVGALINAVFEAGGAVASRTLFDLDEARQLQRMRILQIVRDAGRKHGIVLRLWYQSEGHLAEVWGAEGVRPWFDGLSYRCYAAIQDPKTAESLSQQLGELGVMAYSEGDNRGRSGAFWRGGRTSTSGRNENKHEIKRRLMLPSELMQDMRTDEQIIIPRQGLPIRCGRALYFRRPEMVAQIAQSRYHRRVA